MTDPSAWQPPEGISERDLAICRGRLEGLSLRQIALRAGVSHQTAANILRANGLPPAPRPRAPVADIKRLRRDGKQPKDIARILNVNPSTVRDVLARHGMTGPRDNWLRQPPRQPSSYRARPVRRNGVADIDPGRLRALISDGLNAAQLARELNTSPRTIGRLLDQLGLQATNGVGVPRSSVDEGELRRLAAQRMPATRIARELGVSDRTVRRMLDELRLR